MCSGAGCCDPHQAPADGTDQQQLGSILSIHRPTVEPRLWISYCVVLAGQLSWVNVIVPRHPSMRVLIFAVQLADLMLLD